MEDVLSRVFGNLGVLAIAGTTLLLLLAEFGYRQGRRLFVAGDEARRSQIGGVQAAVLGLLGLLLGFTFSMAIDRYDTRRDLVVREANAIRTAWLRGSLLPEAHRQPVRDAIRESLDLSIRARGELRDPVRLADTVRRTEAVEARLWRHAEAASIEAPNDITATFLDALNDMIDTDHERLAASRSRIPVGVWLLLLLVAAVGCWTSAYGAGANGVRSVLTCALLPLLITVVIVLVGDLASEREGLISVSQQPLVDLQNSIRSQ
jgi:hypothetical protein